MESDLNNLEFHYNNYIYPKPVEDINKEIIHLGKVPYADPNFSWHLLWPEKIFNSKNLNILIAGCGSDQAAILAKCNPGHIFTGIDLSKNSINHQQKLKDKYLLKNLNLICDDFRNVKFENKFDYIISTGVIHHLIKPESALSYFYNNLSDDGVVYLMVYGDKESQSINEIKKVLNKINLDQDDKSVDITKNIFKNLKSNHPAKIFTNKIEDIKYNAGVVDLMLHKKEKFYSIKELVNTLKKNKLVIKNFFDGRIPSVTKFFLDDVDCLKKIREMDIDTKLEMGQILNWNDRLIELILSKKKNLKESLIYNKQIVGDLYIYPNRALKYKVTPHSIDILENYSGNKYNYDFSNKIDLDWKRIFSGKYKLRETLNQKESDLNFIFSLFDLMLENFHIDVSKKPIGNYLDHFGK